MCTYRTYNCKNSVKSKATLHSFVLTSDWNEINNIFFFRKSSALVCLHRQPICFVLFVSELAVVFRVSCCVPSQLLCSDSAAVFRVSCCVQIQRLCSESAVVLRFSGCVPSQLLCSESAVVFWISCCVPNQLCVSNQLFLPNQLLCFDLCKRICVHSIEHLVVRFRV